MGKIALLFFVFVVLLPLSYAADDGFKPYLHKASVPEHPDVKLFGQYKTNLFPGAATYSYPIEVPKGTTGLQPSIVLSYNSQAVNGRPGVAGAGWSLPANQIYREVNNTLGDISDDEFKLVLDGNLYELRYAPSDGYWHTEVEYYFKVQNLSAAPNEQGVYWQVTKKDGMKYRFGYNTDSELASNTGQNFSTKWSLDLVEDLFGNQISYSYLENPTAQDNSSMYLSSVVYNQREVRFSYENSVRPDRRRVYENGNEVEESRRLTDISVFAGNVLVRRYHLDYSTLNPALSSISEITDYGADNTSIWYNVSFEYYASTPGYEKDMSLWVPPVIFSDNAHEDYGVRFVDFNNDGFSDLVQARQASLVKVVWLNNKTGNWTEDPSWTLPVYIVNPSGEDLGVRFVDVNRDGFQDLIKSAGGARTVYLNNGTGFANATDYSSSDWVFPYDIVNNPLSDMGVRLVDVDGDGFVDIIKGRGSEPRAVYLNNGHGWEVSSSWNTTFDFVNANHVDLGLREADVNGDGMVDILEGSESRAVRKAWLNNGSSWVENSIWAPPVYFTNGADADKGARFADLNGDGLVDLVVDFTNTSETTRDAWINTGRGWSSDSSWQSPEAFTSSGFNVGRRLADVNGDGFVDVVVAHEDDATKYTWVKNSTIPYLLRAIINEYGGRTTLNYTTSTSFNNSEDGLSDLGFNIFVVGNVTSHNNVSGDLGVNSSFAYNYSFGKYNYDNFEFRGFGRTEEIQDNSVVKHYFYQDDPRRGKEYKTEVFSLNGSLFSVDLKEFNHTQDNGIFNVTLRFSSLYLYDGAGNPKVTNKTFVYDSSGNVLFVTDFGEANVSGDERFYNYTYSKDTDDWILDRVATSTVIDSNGDEIKKTLFYYDDLGLNAVGSKGALSKKEDWNNNGNNSYSYFEYDGFGNVVKSTDSVGNSVSYNYDSTYTYPVSVVNALGHVSVYNYDLGTGNLLFEEKNGIRKNFEYDTFGRIVKEIMPLDSSTLPTKSYSYSFDGVAPEAITISLKTTSNKTNNVRYYYDGFANLIQLKTDVENGQQIVKNILYDGLGRVKQEQNPYFAVFNNNLSDVSAGENYTFYSYDALDRVVGVLNPDGTAKNITFDRWNISDTDENGNEHIYEIDAHDRIVKVHELFYDSIIFKNETFVTSYSYDGNDNLVKIVDNEGNEFKFTYDSLSRKTKMDDPDLGMWTYSYDQNGNLVLQNDSRTEEIRLSYDGLNRVLTKNSTDVNIVFGYDKDYQGTLSNISKGDPNITYQYDDRLRVIKEIHTSGGSAVEFSYIYDSQDRVISKEGFTNIDFLFNKQGKVTQIPGFITASSFNPFGSITNRTYANNLIQKFEYANATNRITSIEIPNVQNLTYTYDQVGNILLINDIVNSRLHNLTYDSLDRLKSAKVGPDRFVYSYDSLGRILKIVKNNESKKFVYNSTHAHAPSKVITGSSGVDVYHITELNSGTKNRTFEFFLENDKNTSTSGVNWSIDFGSEQAASSLPFSLNSNVMVIVQNNYTDGGDHGFTVTAQSPNVTDKEVNAIKFGVRANQLNLLLRNASQSLFEFEVKNDLTEQVRDVSWNCSEGLLSIYKFNLTGNQSLYDYMHVNFTSPGKKNFTCTASSVDGTESKSIELDIKGLEVENYDVLKQNGSKQIISFNAKNYYWNLNPNISVDTGEEVFSKNVTLDKDAFVMVFSEVNYNSDGSRKSYAITLDGGANATTNYASTFALEGATIENYTRTSTGTVQNYVFYIKNNWFAGDVTWTLNDPVTTNTTSMAHNETVRFSISHNYTTQGPKHILLTAQVSTFIDTVTDYFDVKPLQVSELNTLSESQASTINELVVKNNLNHTLFFNWQFQTGQENLTSTLLNSTNGTTLIYIATNYSAAGVFRTTAIVNSSSYNDNQTGVVVT